MNRCRGFAVASVSLACGVWGGLAGAQEIAPTQDAERHFDARLDLNRGFTAARSAAAVQPQSIQGLIANVEELTVESNETTGAVHSLSSQRGYLTAAARGRPLDLAMAFIRSNVAALGLEPSDLQGYAVSDVVYSRVTGATHIYLQQRHAGIPVYNGQLQVNVNRDGRIISVNNAFLPALADSVRALQPRMPLAAAVGVAAKFSGIAVPAQLKALQSTPGPQQATRVNHEGALARADQRTLDAVADPTRRGEAGLEFPDPYTR